MCKVYIRQPCGKVWCCRGCKKYDECKHNKCKNDPNKCARFKEKRIKTNEGER